VPRFVNLLTFFFLNLCLYPAQAQKKAVTNDTYYTWQYLYPDYNISNNGRYLWYRYGSPATGDFLVLTTTDNKKKQVFPKGFEPAFTNDSHSFIFRLPHDTLIIQATDNSTSQILSDVTDYTLSGNTLVLQTHNTLIYGSKTISAQHYALDPSGIQLAFIVNNQLRYYNPGMDTSILLQQDVCGQLHFSRDGMRLFFQSPQTRADSHPQVRIWHYNDYYLPTQQSIVRNKQMVIDLLQRKTLQLDSTGIEICDYGNKYVLAQNILNYSEYYWNKSNISTIYLINMQNGERIKIRQNKDVPVIHAKLSPEEKYITWYEDQYYCYEIATAITRKIPAAQELVQWLAGDSALLIYDTHDTWQVDPSAEKAAVNLTKSPPKVISRIIVPGFTTIFNTRNKYNNAEPYLYYFPQYPLDAFKPLKARDTNIYLVQRMSDTASPNLFITGDLKSFIRITHFEPEKSYNWMQATLVKNGILYKPENFNPDKKYPLIFHYYEKSSDQLFLFRRPSLSVGNLDIAWYVSNGYLVFIPDINTIKGHPGKSTRSVIRAARYFRRMPWVDKKRLGLQGHSFGAYLTNYLITHSSLFAAAQESAGPVDFISGYGAIKKQTGNTMQYLYERGQNNMGTTPWKRPRRYIKNSPVFSINRVTTPLLILHNEEDNAVPVAQGIELFTALRRLQKPVWLLQYDREAHILINEHNQLDFSQHQQQFFDHYLKGKPAPGWMKLKGL
jgi:dipeptidyl aminopeptidase/acylaminoacyl peptidase